jgi:hypothetical protein
MDEDTQTTKALRAFNSLTDLLLLYVSKRYECTGFLSPATTFTLKIEGPFGKRELAFLIKRLRDDAKMLGDEQINHSTPIIERLDEIKKLATEEPTQVKAA